MVLSVQEKCVTFFLYIETASIKNRTFHNVAAVFFSLQNKEDHIKGTDNNIMRLDLREYRSNSFFFFLYWIGWYYLTLCTINFEDNTCMIWFKSNNFTKWIYYPGKLKLHVFIFNFWHLYFSQTLAYVHCKFSILHIENGDTKFEKLLWVENTIN